MKVVKPYNGSVGHSGTDTSEARAQSESKAAADKQAKTVALMHRRGPMGITVAELREFNFMNHHGTASGTLSNLNKGGVIDLLDEVRNGCHVYVLPEYREGRDIYKRRRSVKDNAHLDGYASALDDLADLISSSTQNLILTRREILRMINSLRGES